MNNFKEFRHKKSLGQNFMMDKNVARKIANSANITKDDSVLEIGPGAGILTLELLERAADVTAVEIDSVLVGMLTEEFKDEERLTLTNQDFLKFDIAGLAHEKGKSIKVIGNIPYHITSQIIIHVLNNRTSITDFTATMQKEVAVRITAKPGKKDYGILSVYSNFYAIPKKLFDVSRGVFNPKPKVESSVIRFEMRETLPGELKNEKLFRTVIRRCFGKRRKMIKNTLKEFGECVGYLEDAGFDLTKRPEALGTTEFLAISNALFDWQKLSG